MMNFQQFNGTNKTAYKNAYKLICLNYIISAVQLFQLLIICIIWTHDNHRNSFSCYCNKGQRCTCSMTLWRCRYMCSAHNGFSWSPTLVDGQHCRGVALHKDELKPDCVSLEGLGSHPRLGSHLAGPVSSL